MGPKKKKLVKAARISSYSTQIRHKNMKPTSQTKVITGRFSKKKAEATFRHASFPQLQTGGYINNHSSTLMGLKLLTSDSKPQVRSFKVRL